MSRLLGDPSGVIDAGWELHDAVAEPYPLRSLARCGEEHLGRRGVRVLLEEVVLHLPDAVEARALGHLNLLQRILEQAALGVLAPRPRELMLVEEAESHSAGRIGRQS